MKEIYESPMLLDVQEVSGADICITCGGTRPKDDVAPAN